MNVLEKILEEIEQEAMTNKEIGRKQCEGMIKAMDIIRFHINEVENDGWIPVEERLPEYREDYLVTVKYTGFMGMHGIWIKTGHLEFDNKWYGNCFGGEVIAWQPLPKPYRPEQ